MKGDVVHAVVAEYSASPDIGIVSWDEAISVSVSKTTDGQYIVNVESTSEEPVRAIVELNGDEPIWEGDLSA